MKLISVLLLIASIISGCSQLSPAGTLVQIVDKTTLPGGYKMIGRVACRSEIYMVTKDTNRERCKDQLRNAASKLGATAVIIDKIEELPGFFSTGFDMFGAAYGE